jgi:transcriptional regulator with XRE-family HTH domain
VDRSAQELARCLGKRIADLRAARGLTQERLAWEAGLASKGYLSRIESGERLPSLVVLGRLAQRLDAEVRDLLIFPDRGRVDAAMDRIRVFGEASGRGAPRVRHASNAAEPPPSYTKGARTPAAAKRRP